MQDTSTAQVCGYDDYDPWGYILASRSVNSVCGPTPMVTRNKFTGKEFDDEFGLNWNYFGARYYDPQIGRWFVPDPAGEGWSPYSYAGNNPLSFVDPNGEFIIEAIIAANLLYSTIQGYRAGGLGGAYGAFVQSAVITGFSMGLAAPVGGAVYGATGSATLSMTASSAVSSGVGSLMSGQGFSPVTGFGFGSFDWKSGGFQWAFSGRGFISNAMDAWSIYGSTLHDALLVGQKIQHLLSAEARANLAQARSQMIAKNQSAEDPTKYNLDGNTYEAEEISDQDYWDAKAKYAPGAKNRSTILDPLARRLGYPPDVQKSGSEEHVRGYRVLGGAHYGYDRVKPGQYRWRVHIDRFDPLALGGLAAIGHWAYESVNPMVQIFRARALSGYGY